MQFFPFPKPKPFLERFFIHTFENGIFSLDSMSAKVDHGLNWAIIAYTKDVLATAMVFKSGAIITYTEDV